MALYDIMDEIAAKQILKTDTGDNRIFGVIVATVVNNYDEKQPGKVCIQIPVRDKEANELKWARVAMPSSGEKWGSYFLPEVGDQVLVTFEQGNIEKPYIIGCIPKDNNQFLKKAVHEKNQIKKIQTRYGSTIQFDDVFADSESDKGKKDKISIFTKDKAHQLIIDNENNEILISDKEKKNKISIKSQNGLISVDCEKKLEVKVGDSIKLIMNGESGSVTLQCDKLDVKTSDSFNVKADGKVKLVGNSATVEGSQKATFKSGAMTTIGGSPIKLG